MDVEQRVLILAPFGRDAEHLSGVVVALGMTAQPCATVADWSAMLSDGALATLITEEAMTPEFGAAAVDAGAAQPEWSSPTLIALVDEPDRPPAALSRILAEGDTVSCLVLERPVKRRQLDAALSIQARFRRRQYQVRDLIADLRRREEHERFLLHELDHRVRNTLSHLRGLLTMAARHAGSAEELAESHSNRIMALARIHELLGGSNADTGARLADLVEVAVEPYLLGADQVACDGPDLSVGRRTATSLTMVLHELATNASKYGALSTPDGRVAVRWSGAGGGSVSGATDGGPALTLEWVECGGPPVSPPSRKGFGSQMLEQFAAMELGAEVELRHDPQGVSYRLTAGTFRD